MRKFITSFCVCFFAANAFAQTEKPMSYYEEVKALGAVAGQGLACKASKQDKFELLARAILITKAPSDSAQAAAMQIYNESKADAFFSKQVDGFYSCSGIAARFDAQEIFNITLYADGTIKMPDGKIFTPRHPYDATLVFDKSKEINAEAIYKKGDGKTAKVTVKDDRSNLLPPLEK